MKIIIHGVHRSGTSYVASLLEKAGFFCSTPKNRMKGAKDNKNGFWERLDVVEINSKILETHGMSWASIKPNIFHKNKTFDTSEYDSKIIKVINDLNQQENWILKDPRLSFTWPYWSKHLDDVHHIIVVRNPLLVSKSLSKRNNISTSQGLIFWTHQSLQIIENLKNNKNVCIVIFDGKEKGSALLEKQIFDFIDRYSESNKKGSTQVLSTFDVSLSNSDDSILIPREFPLTIRLWNSFQERVLPVSSDFKPFDTSVLNWSEIDSTFNAIELTREPKEDLSLALKNLIKYKQLHSSDLKILNAEIKLLKEDVIKEREEASLLKTHNDDLKTHNDDLKTLNDDLKTQCDNQLRILSNINENLLAFNDSVTFKSIALLMRPLSVLRKSNRNALHKALEFSYEGIIDLNNNITEEQSSRRMLLKAIINNPRHLFKNLTFKRVQTGLNILFNKEGFHLNQFNIALKKYTQIDEVKNETNLSNSTLLEDIAFNSCPKPLISIVIPVYNEIETTLNCLKAIQEHTNTDLLNRCEIIVANDCSTDNTLKLDSRPGVILINNEVNLGFLGNCNNAVNSAKGEFVILLNNDTNVQKGWLQSLYREISSDEGIGIVGPRFLYPDGRLQEAGGIIFQDGSGWNYGRLDNADKPEYKFNRDVDYISGACLMYRKSDWDQLGGFDKRFTPAYYEDTDFCFAIRKIGKRVRLVADSHVVHFEGVSHGTDVSNGVKKFQEINKVKFLNKWEKTLQEEHQLSSDFLFKARNFGSNKKTVLIIDHYVPMYDKDAGSRSTFQYIKLLLDQGIHVIFLGENFYPHQPYTDSLQKLGVEVLYGNDYKKNWQPWLLENCKFISAIYLHRPHVTAEFLPFIQQLPTKPRLVYFGHDLHFLRLEREEKLGLPNNSGKTIDEWRNLELKIMRSVDIALYPSKFEVNTIKELDENIDIDYIPLNWFDLEQETRSLNKSLNMLFVGGFGHPPNLDALSWFLNDIFPLILKEIPDATLTIIGSKCPQEILSLNSENIIVLGEVSDEVLKSNYRKARASIVPLRYGAGVKGKIVEAMASSVPVITTKIGSEGLPSEPSDYLLISNEAKDFAGDTVSILLDNDLHQNMTSKSIKIINDYFSKKAALKLISKLGIG